MPHRKIKLKALNKEILQIAVPSIVSNVTVPLLGLVDTAITGHLGAASYLAAIAIGTSIFSLCYWAFSFLRMGTGGLTAQAFGRGSWTECRECLRKALTIAVVAGIAIIALQALIADVALWLMDADGDVDRWARLYFRILGWGAPANLALSAMNGWFIGMQDARSPMLIAVGQNVLNIVVSCTLVMGLGWKVEGVATGTLVAQWAGAAAALCFVAKHLCRKKNIKRIEAIDAIDAIETIETIETIATIKSIKTRGPQDNSAPTAAQKPLSWARFFSINRDIFLRTACLIAVMFSFTAFGSRQGEITLAVNALIMQMFLLVSYVMDGFAYAGEAIGGRMMGARDAAGFTTLTHRLFTWGAVASGLFTLAFALGGDAIMAVLTDNAAVRTAAHDYLWVTMAVPFVSLAAFIYDGLFIGTTSTRGMLTSIAIATAAYFAIALTTTSNAALWTAFLVYMALRGAVQHLLMGKIKARRF